MTKLFLKIPSVLRSVIMLACAFGAYFLMASDDTTLQIIGYVLLGLMVVCLIYDRKAMKIEKAEKEAEKRRMKEKGVATKPVKAKDKNTNKNNPNPDGDGDKLTQVISEETGDILISDDPEETGGGSGHGPSPKPEEKPGKENPEGKFDFIKEHLSNMQFKFFCLDKSTAKYAITFTSVYDIKNAHVVITPMDESNGVVEIKIFNVTVNNVKTLINDNNEVIIDLVKEAKYKIQFNVDQNEYFACGVKAYAYKK